MCLHHLPGQKKVSVYTASAEQQLETKYNWLSGPCFMTFLVKTAVEGNKAKVIAIILYDVENKVDRG